ncbi:carcinoembryonic antigen-related cell adhesion molecule 5-like [Python bivittatus]|uniref:Carcinoembryonic antigen-related cell adhesion molecule 5-like n=1 Tax=Python bivittatus TaxID=176946 RepID=A0A9F5J0T8_PYTBI|nr:carcinoembryonic antigen-related cell adhesion molecule 5-like [Python bivittatus]
MTRGLQPPFDANKTGPAYTGRETIYPDCSLHIQNLSLSDASNYKLKETGTGASYIGNVSFTVQEFLPKPDVTVFPSPFLVEKASVQLVCHTTITKIVQWLKNGKPVSDDAHLTDHNRTLSIPSVTRNDTGSYECFVSNGISNVTSDPVYLSVIYGPDTPTIRPTEICYAEHSVIILFCSADSFPQPQYVWFHNKKQIETGPTLVIKDFTEDNTGEYTCEARNELLNLRKRSAVQKLYLEKSCVSNVTITGPPEAIEGQSIILHCTANGDSVSYSWTKGSHEVHPDGRISLTNNNQNLEFNPCHRSDAADYTCHASNSFSSNKSDPYRLDIIYGPDPPIINETIDLPRAQLNLTCKAAAFPDTEKIWFYNGNPVPERPTMLSLNIVKENSGNYTCRAINTLSGVTRETTLEIDMIEFLPKPNVIAKPSNSIEEFASGSLTCNTSEDLNIKWFKNGELFKKESQLLDNNQTLFIPSVIKSDAGRYQCQISNTNSTRISDVLNLNVLYGPDTPEIQPTERYYEEHSKVLLSCTADSCPQPQYVWFHNGKRLDTGPKLFIVDFTKDKTGSYICQAENELLRKKRNSSSLEIYLEKSRVSQVTITGPSKAIENKLISLRCTSRGENVSYSWTKGSQVVHSGGRISLINNNQTLRFNPCHRSDAADYTCHASNSISSDKSNPYRLDIIYGPDPPIINETIDVPQEQLKLTCNAAAFPPGFYTWFYNGMELADKILFQKISQENSGNYTCRVINPVSFLKRNTTLEIDMIRKFKSRKRK